METVPLTIKKERGM